MSLGLSVFQYPMTAHVRRHGPVGYDEYSSYKPWLRDEFTFRCVYCLIRERWYPDGANAFGVDHFIPKSIRADLFCVYDNLLYVCNRCNSAKQVTSVLNPCAVGLGEHLQVMEDGTLIALTKEGEHLIDALNLNYSLAREYRRRKIDAFARWQASSDTFTIDEELAFPDDLPRLDNRKCVNSRPQGINESWYFKREQGLLPPTY